MKIHVCEENGFILSESDRDYIQLLEKDLNFEKLIKLSRRNIGLKTLLSSFPTAKIYSRSYEEAQKIVDFYNLPDSWIFSLQFFIVMGKFMPTGEGIALSGDSQRYSQSVDNFKTSPIEITITQRMSFSDFYDWVMDHKSEIKKRLQNLPRKRKVKNKSSNDRLFKYKLEMFELTQKGYTATLIDKKLCEKYPDLEKESIITYSNIQRWMREFKNALRGAPLGSKLR